MAIASTEIQLRLSGGASNTSPAASLGGARSSTQVGTDLFDNLDGTESAAGRVDYRCGYVFNANTSLTFQGAKMWISADTAAPGTKIEIGIGTAALNATEQTVGSETAAPAGVTFSAAGSEAAALALGDIGPQQSRSVWFRRTTTAGAVASNDTATYEIAGDTAA